MEDKKDEKDSGCGCVLPFIGAFLLETISKVVAFDMMEDKAALISAYKGWYMDCGNFWPSLFLTFTLWELYVGLFIILCVIVILIFFYYKAAFGED